MLPRRQLGDALGVRMGCKGRGKIKVVFGLLNGVYRHCTCLYGSVPTFTLNFIDQAVAILIV